MAKSINEKYLEQTENAFCDTRFDLSEFSQNMARQPLMTQRNYFKMFISYIDVLARHKDQGWVPFGMSDVAYACEDIRDILNEHFPVDTDAKVFVHGTEWEQI